MEIRPILSTLLRSRTGAVLVAAQVAITLAIVSNGLFVVSNHLEIADRPTGIDEANVFQLFYVVSGELQDPATMRQRDLEALRAIPGLKAAAATNSMPLGTSGWGVELSVDPERPNSGVVGSAYFSGDGLIDALGLTLADGRDFLPEEIHEIDGDSEQPSADAVILSRQMAERLFPDQPSVVGKTVQLHVGAEPRPVRVVGVVEILMNPFGQTSDSAYQTFILPVRYLDRTAHYAIRTESGQRARVMAEAEKALTALRDDRVLIHHRSMDELRERRYRHERAGAGMLIAVTIGLLLVTASGIVGVASLWVNQRRKQIGVRRALGASRLDILRYFVTENLLITTGGVTAGAALSLALNQFLISRVELGRLPPGYIVAGVLVLWGLGVLAVLGPAWRAAAVPPAIATRSA